MNLMRRAKPILLLTILSLAGPGTALADDLRTRFHDAYVLEVIEGKVAEAAVTYLTLLEDETASARLRAEARFRFAICAVLLGRADEGRAHLSALIRDKFTSETLRDRAREYLRSVSDIGVGSELDKKLQALLFDLGRQSPYHPQPSAYRDFEIIGERAIPFLRKLMGHADKSLRTHAFRLLCRLNAPGVATLWTPPALGNGGDRDFMAYLKRHPQERVVLEKRILELGEPALHQAQYLPVGTAPFFTRAFVLRAVAAGLRPGTAVAWLGLPLKEADFEQLVVWMRGSDIGLADAATAWLLRYGTEHPGADEAFQEAVFTRLLGRLQDPDAEIRSEGLQKFKLLSGRLPSASILAQLERTIQDVETHGGILDKRRAAILLLEPLAAAVHGKELSPELAEHYVALLLRWRALLGPDGGPDPLTLTPELGAHFRMALARMPEARALVLARRLFSVPGRSRWPSWRTMLPAALTPRNVRLLATVIEAAPAGERKHLFGALNVAPGKASTPALTEELDAAHLSLMSVLTPAELMAFFHGYDRVLAQRPASDVRRQVRAVLEKARTLPGQARSAVLQRVLTGNHEYVEKILVPLAESTWDWLDATERGLLFDVAFGLRRSALVSVPDVRIRLADAAAAIIKPHVADLADFERFNDIFSLRDDLARYPIHLWLPLLPDAWGPSVQNLRNLGMQLSRDDAGREAQRMTRSPKAPSAVVLGFVRAFCSPEVGAKIFDTQLRSEDPQRRGIALSVLPLSGAPADAAGIEALIAKELALETPGPERLRKAGAILLNLRPSAKLFRVARVLLASEDAGNVLAGIRMAASLGQGDLLAALRPHLESMNSKIRVEAGKAVASIQAIAALGVGLPGK